MKRAMKFSIVVAGLCTVGLLGYWNPSFGQTGCNVQCAGFSCYKDCKGKYYLFDNDFICNMWWNANGGCTSANCCCAGTVPNNTYHECSGAAGCSPTCVGTQTINGGQPKICQEPVGDKMGPYGCCGGCAPLSSPLCNKGS